MRSLGTRAKWFELGLAEPGPLPGLADAPTPSRASVGSGLAEPGPSPGLAEPGPSPGLPEAPAPEELP